MPPDSGNIAPSSAYVTAMNRTTTAPMTHAQIAPGPASMAARHAPNSQPEPMIEPSPVNISAQAPTWRRMANSLDMDEGLVRSVDGRMRGMIADRAAIVSVAGSRARMEQQVHHDQRGDQQQQRERQPGPKEIARLVAARARHDQDRGAGSGDQEGVGNRDRDDQRIHARVSAGSQGDV